jgi:hypothetical protein
MFQHHVPNNVPFYTRPYQKLFSHARVSLRSASLSNIQAGLGLCICIFAFSSSCLPRKTFEKQAKECNGTVARLLCMEESVWFIKGSFGTPLHYATAIHTSPQCSVLSKSVMVYPEERADHNSLSTWPAGNFREHRVSAVRTVCGTVRSVAVNSTPPVLAIAETPKGFRKCQGGGVELTATDRTTPHSSASHRSSGRDNCVLRTGGDNEHGDDHGTLHCVCNVLHMQTSAEDFPRLQTEGSELQTSCSRKHASIYLKLRGCGICSR